MIKMSANDVKLREGENKMMNLNMLRDRIDAQVAANDESKKGFTLADMEGKFIPPTLPVGLHEVVIAEVPVDGSSNIFKMLVDETIKGKTTRYTIEIFVGSSTQQADMFIRTMSHLMKQLDMDKFSLKTIQGKVGTTICVLVSENTTAKGTFVNYKFDEKSMRAAL